MPRLFLGAALSLALASLPAAAIPSGSAQAQVIRHLEACQPFGNCPSSSGPLIPLPDGSWWRAAGFQPLGAEFNSALAVAALRPVPGQPLDRLLQLGVMASMDRSVSLTADGLPGPVLPREQLPVHVAHASASFSDLLQFLDPTLPLGAPLSVSFTWTLSSDYCAPALNCRLRDPQVPPVLPPSTLRAHANASTAVLSSVDLPGGTSAVSDAFVHAASDPAQADSAYVAQRIVGRPHTLTHQFSVLNGASHLYTVAATAAITLDAANLVDWSVVGLPSTQLPLQRALNLLDYADTLHLTDLRGFDANGQPLGALRVLTSLGLGIVPEALPAVPEPGSAALLLAGLLALARRGRRRAALLLCSGALVSPMALHAQALPAPEVWVAGQVCCNDGGGQDFAQRAAQGVAGGAARSQGFNGSMHAQAQAGFGFVRLLAETGGNGFADASAGFTDQLTLLPANPAWMGEYAVLSWTFRLTGGVLLLDMASGGFGSVSADARALGALPGTGVQATQWHNPQDDFAPQDIQGQALPWQVTVRQGFVFGEPFTIGLELRAFSGSFDAYGLLDLLHTATWEGVSEVSLAGVALAADAYTLQSASGTDYRGPISPVPEPASQALWLSALLGLLLARRRRSGG